MLGHQEMAKLLMHTCNPVIRNNEGWTAVDEAISRADRALLYDVLKRRRTHTQEALQCMKADMLNVLSSIGDFYMELKWEFQSWSKFDLITNFIMQDVIL